MFGESLENGMRAIGIEMKEGGHSEVGNSIKDNLKLVWRWMNYQDK